MFVLFAVIISEVFLAFFPIRLFTLGENTGILILTSVVDTKSGSNLNNAVEQLKRREG